MMQKATISILIIVRNDRVRQFVGEQLKLRDDFHVMGICESLQAFLSEPQRHEFPQVVLLDDTLQPGGLRTVKKLRHRIPNSDIVLFTFSNNSEDIYNGFCAGASGHILQTDAMEDIISEIRGIIRGDIIIVPSIAQKILDSQLLFNEYTLSVTEVKLMQAMVDGHSLQYIENTLKIPMQVIRSKIKSIFQKLHHSTQLATASD